MLLGFGTMFISLASSYSGPGLWRQYNVCPLSVSKFEQQRRMKAIALSWEDPKMGNSCLLVKGGPQSGLPKLPLCSAERSSLLCPVLLHRNWSYLVAAGSEFQKSAIVTWLNRLGQDHG